MFLTKPLKIAQHSDSVTGLLRLNEGGITEQRLSTSGKWKYDPISIQDFAVDLAFILLKVKNTSYLIISTMYDILCFTYCNQYFISHKYFCI
ncbi:unnamed protein product [Rhizophagus irregularis]|nr:unnamed protein product [Rhizophagus irregularis]